MGDDARVGSGDSIMRDVTAAMESFALDPLVGAEDSGEYSTPLTNPNPQSHRPLDDVIQAGPPAHPIEFDKPRFERGRRDDVLCYNAKTQKHDVAKNVLFRDYSREYGDPDGALSRVQQAYWPLPYKEKIKTIMGHVEICIVLTRCNPDRGTESSCSDDSSNSDGEEDDVVFQTTQQYVAVKVNYTSRMDKLRNKHAEDPLKEIAAMQLVGHRHPNVMGCLEALFDGKNLNVVMPFCGGGDLFELLQESQEPVDGRPPGIPEPQARFWFRQIVAGLKHLHSVGVCHRDLSPENVMIDTNNCMIIDMGMCLRIPYSSPGSSPGTVTDRRSGTHRRMMKPQGACGKLPYMAMETYCNRDPFDGPSIDIWTAGTILFCMVTGNRSYQRPHTTDPQFYWMTHGLERLLADWDVHLSAECLHLLQNILQIDPRLRLSLDEIERHPWFAFPDEKPPRRGDFAL